MNLFFLLLPICAFCLSFEEIVRQAQAKQRYGKISAEAKAKLLKIWGMDPEARKARLERIAKKAALRLSETSVEAIKSPHFSTVKIEKPNESDVDLFELNNRLGISEYLFQGDMDLTEEQLNKLERELDGNERNKRQAWKFANKWTNNTVYFYFDDDINDEKKESVRTAHKYLESNTCINFVENRTAPNRIRVYKGAGCGSNVGMIGGEQSLSYGNGCENVGIAAHEFAHALGFYHAQSRSDRDNYVTVQKDNIQDGREGNFFKLSAADDTIYNPYEYGSFLHYAATLFTKTYGAFTLVPKDEKYLYTMGNRQISFYDYYMINKYYGCDVNCPAQTSAQCKNGGYPNPRNCSKCNCPAGYGGDLCDERPSGCGWTFRATSEWQFGVMFVGNESIEEVRNDYTTCNYWVTAPEGTQIQIKLIYLKNGWCNYGCFHNGIEIKTEKNTRIRNPLICCEEFTNKVFNSSLNPTPIIPFNRYRSSEFHIEFRYIGDPSPTTTAKPTTTTAPPATTTEEEEVICEDFMVCDPRKDCSSSNALYCAKTCGFCKDPSIVTATQPRMTPTVAATTTEPEEEICEDFMVCDSVKDCSYDNWYCAKTCGLCGGAETKTTTSPATTTEEEKVICEDFIFGCAQQDCSSTFASNYCAKTCRLCGENRCEDAVYCDTAMARNNCADVDPAFAKKYCARTCGYCPSL